MELPGVLSFNNYSTSAISCTYTWSVLPNVNSNNSLIRITDAANASKTDVSDANFTLAASSNIVLLTPNGGEQWKAITSASSSGSSYNMSNASGNNFIWIFLTIAAVHRVITVLTKVIQKLLRRLFRGLCSSLNLQLSALILPARDRVFTMKLTIHHRH